MQSTHRSGPLKQKNKAHHTLGHKSNRQIKQRIGGKIGSHESLVKKNKLLEWRHDRKNRERDLKKQKRQIAYNLKRSLGQLYNAPYLVTVLYFSDTPEQTGRGIIEILTNSEQENGEIHRSSQGDLILLTSSRLKSRFQFHAVDTNDLFACLDACKVSDILLCVYNAQDENKIDELKKEANSTLNGIYHHCMPTCVHVVHAMNEVPSKKQSNVKKLFQKQLDAWFPGERLHFLDNKSDAQQLLNIIGNCKKKPIAYRDRRSQLVADRLEFVEDEDDNTKGTLTAYGFVRNKNLDVDKLIHVPGVGDFEISVVEVLPDPFKTDKQKNQEQKNDGDVDMSMGCVYRRDVLNAQKLQSPIDPTSDEFVHQEQELPTAEDIAKAEMEHLKQKKLVPKGTSEYQAAWFVDSDEDGEDCADDLASNSDDLDMENCDQAKFAEDDQSDDSDERMESDDDNDDDVDLQSLAPTENYDHKYDERLDMDEEMCTLQRIKEEKQNEMFPDEMDTPSNVPAKMRFIKYRGLASFHKTKWDPYENLPSEYSHIFQFQNMKRSRNLAYQAADEASGPCAGKYVMVQISKFDKVAYENYKNNPNSLFLFFQLLKNEQNMCIMHVTLKKHPSFTLPIQSKERLLFNVGCRRYSVCPIFSLHSNGNKHKYERFLRADTQMVASFFAPLTFSPCSASVYKQLQDGGSFHLVATGSVLNNDPCRVVVKRIILSGHPFKIHKTFSVIRYMFFNRDDILWFKPIELRTKFGRKGTIKEPLGTHGHMKCVFDNTIKSNDTVLMNLYKRVFPKWTYQPNICNSII